MRRVLQGKGGEGDEGAVHFQTMQLTRGAQARWDFCICIILIFFFPFLHFVFLYFQVIFKILPRCWV